jgi:hypothetical protein
MALTMEPEDRVECTMCVNYTECYPSDCGCASYSYCSLCVSKIIGSVRRPSPAVMQNVLDGKFTTKTKLALKNWALSAVWVCGDGDCSKPLSFHKLGGLVGPDDDEDLESDEELASSPLPADGGGASSPVPAERASSPLPADRGGASSPVPAERASSPLPADRGGASSPVPAERASSPLP